MPGLYGFNDNDPKKYLEIRDRVSPKQQPQQQQGGGLMGDPSNIQSMISQFTGGGGQAGSFASPSAGSGGASQLGEVGIGGEAGGGMGAMGIGAIIAAAIAAQHYMSNKTDTEFEGQKTNDAFSGNFGTEPWFAFVSDKLGMEPTAGEKFDAAINNEDWGKAARRLPDMTSYWADPARAVGTSFIRKYVGDTAADVIDPAGWLTRKIAG